MIDMGEERRTKLGDALLERLAAPAHNNGLRPEFEESVTGMPFTRMAAVLGEEKRVPTLGLFLNPRPFGLMRPRCEVIDMQEGKRWLAERARDWKLDIPQPEPEQKTTGDKT
jgi:hypothetical protein